MENVSVSTSARTTMVINFDVPDALRSVLDAVFEGNNDAQPDEIVVTIGHVRIGRVNVHTRQWDNIHASFRPARF